MHGMIWARSSAGLDYSSDFLYRDGRRDLKFFGCVSLHSIGRVEERLLLREVQPDVPPAKGLQLYTIRAEIAGADFFFH